MVVSCQHVCVTELSVQDPPVPCLEVKISVKNDDDEQKW